MYSRVRISRGRHCIQIRLYLMNCVQVWSPSRSFVKSGVSSVPTWGWTLTTRLLTTLLEASTSTRTAVLTSLSFWKPSGLCTNWKTRGPVHWRHVSEWQKCGEVLQPLIWAVPEQIHEDVTQRKVFKIKSFGVFVGLCNIWGLFEKQNVRNKDSNKS